MNTTVEHLWMNYNQDEIQETLYRQMLRAERGETSTFYIFFKNLFNKQYTHIHFIIFFS